MLFRSFLRAFEVYARRCEPARFNTRQRASAAIILLFHMIMQKNARHANSHVVQMRSRRPGILHNNIFDELVVWMLRCSMLLCDKPNSSLNMHRIVLLRKGEVYKHEGQAEDNYILLKSFVSMHALLHSACYIYSLGL